MEIQNEKTLKTTVASQVGKPVKLRLKDGEEIGGVVAGFGDGVVQISEFFGKETYDMTVSLDAIGVVIVRVG